MVVCGIASARLCREGAGDKPLSIAKAAVTTFQSEDVHNPPQLRRRSGGTHTQTHETPRATPPQKNQSELLLASVNVGVLGAVLNIGAAPRPSTLGVVDYGGGVRTLGLCPPSPNCISTAEALNDIGHYVPPL